MSRLVIHHEPAGALHRFAVQRVDANGVKAAPVVELADPLSQTLGSTDYSLGAELSWYLESYLDYPFGPNQQRAERVTAALRAWGQQAFELLFGQGQARDFYRDATRHGHTELHLVVASDDARVLAWPWEALHDPLAGDLAHLCRIERQLDRVGEPPLPHPALSQERIGILLVTARPFEHDVAYRSISRPLVELIHDGDLPAEVKLLRPPTFAQLCLELQANPGAYHIVHFDGHGGLGSVGLAGQPAGHQFKGPQGQLWFERDDGSPDPITGVQLSQLLREHRIPIAVLNACQSGTLGSEAEDAFASVATSLLRAGVRSVVAMGYALYVSAAKEFLPAFYRRLFESASVAEATRAGRQALLARPERRPGFVLQDWLVPVLYQQDPLPLCFAKQATGQAVRGETEVPEAARLNTSETPHGLIGRDSAVLALERASRRAPAALLVHGLGGVGKTTLVRGYIEWLSRTHGLPQHVVWMSFVDIRSAEYVLNRLVEAVFGTNAMAAPDAQKWPALVKALRDNAWLIVWDNFESASGAADAGPDAGPDTGLDSAMPGADRQQLKQWLEQLRGGKTRVLLTSRSDEAWLGNTACWRIPLGGLQGEERLALAQAILADQGIRLDPKDQDSADLINSLEGHPLMMRAILPKLAVSNAKKLMQAIEQYAPQADSADPVERRLYATLRYVEEGLPPALKPLLYPIGLHEGHVDAVFLADMARLADQPFGLLETQQALALLELAGLVQGVRHNMFRLHPALTRYLRARSAAASTTDEQVLAWQRGFVETMADLADELAPKAMHQQRSFFRIMGGCIEHARRLAQAGEGFEDYAAIMQCLGSYALNRCNLRLAQRHYQAFATQCERHNKEAGAASAYHQLGRVAQELGDFDAAEAWFRKSLEINERLGNEHGAAISYLQFGIVSQLRCDFAEAEAWYRKSLEINLRLRNEQNAASGYHQLGMVAQERYDFAAAEAWYRQSLEIRVRLGDEQGTAGSYHQLGMVAQGLRDFAAAETWYRKSLEISQRLGDEHGAAISYQQLGSMAQERRDFQAAEAWYGRSLEIKERLGNERGAAISYYCLGVAAHEQRDFQAAEAWYRKSLEISERLGDEHGAAIIRRALQLLELLWPALQVAGMTPLETTLAQLSDDLAIEAVKRFAWAHRAPDVRRQLDAATASSLSHALSLPDEQIDAPSAGDLARASLLLLASDPGHRDGIVALINEPAPHTFGPADRVLNVGDVLAMLPSQLVQSAKPSALASDQGAQPRLVRSITQQLMAYAGLRRAGAQSDAQYRVWYATTRRPLDAADPSKGYGIERDEQVHFGSCQVFVPRSHKIGSVGSPWWKRVATLTDDRLRLLSVEPTSGEAFWGHVASHLACCPLQKRDALVFVHGFNVDFEEAALRAAQIGFDLQVKGAMAFFSWASHGALASYLADEAAVELDEIVIADYLCNFALKTGARKVHVIAHSMGNRAVLRAVERIANDAQRRTGVRFGQVILAAPDVDTRLFKQRCSAYCSVADKTTLYVSSRDIAVGASKWLHDFPRAGLMPPVTIAQGIDTVNVVNCDLTLLGHGYVAEARSVIGDIHALINQGTSPPRFGLVLQTTEHGSPYWLIGA